MWICVCQQINDKKLLDSFQGHGNSVKETMRELCSGKQCGGCIRYARDYLTKVNNNTTMPAFIQS